MDVIVVRDDATPDALEELIPSTSNISSSRIIHLSEFIRSHGYRYDSEKGRFILTDGAAMLSPSSGLLLNRVIEISLHSCAQLADAKFAPTRGLVSQIYCKLLEKYKQPFYPENSYSTAGKLVPLFTQWNMVAKSIPGIKIPAFKYGYGPEKINAEDFSNPIYKSPFDFYDWRPNTPPEGIAMDTFVVERPKGKPLLGIVCGHHSATRWLSGESVDSVLADRLRPMLLSIKELFSAFMGESLWFVEDESIVFTSFSHRLSVAPRFPEFKDMLSSALSDISKSSHSN